MSKEMEIYLEYMYFLKKISVFSLIRVKERQIGTPVKAGHEGCYINKVSYKNKLDKNNFAITDL